MFKNVLNKCIVISAFATSIFFTNCSKKLDIYPTDQVDGSVVLSDVPHVNLAVLGVYANWNEEYVNRIGSVLADECRIGLKNTGIGITDAAQNVFRWTYSSNDHEIVDIWANNYKVVYQINDILIAIDKVPTKSDKEVELKKQLKGELLGLRAYLHFDLYRTYANAGIYNASALAVPYVVGTDIYAKPSRPTSDAFFQALYADLDASDKLLDTDSELDRFGATALQALRARVALYTNHWTDAIATSSEVIGTIPLASIAVFPNIWTDQSNAEVIFELSRTNKSPVRPGDMWYNIPNGVYLFAPSKTLMNLYDTANDIRYNSYFNIDSSLVVQGQLPDVIAKYQGTSGAQNLNNLKLFRTAEMYLIRAEAHARTGDVTSAVKDLNELRKHRIQNYTDENYSSAASVLSAIATERYKELCFEGHRYYDFKRLGQDIVRQTIDLPAGSSNTTLSPSSMYYFVPIPQAEVLGNPNILPNNNGW